MKLLCSITPWSERTAERGKGKGNSLKERRVVSLDLYNWLLGLQSKNEDGPIITYAAFGNCRCLLDYLEKNQQDFRNAAKAIIKSLQKLTDSKVKINLKQSGETLGKDIDDAFNTSFMREPYPTVYQRLFKESAEEETSEDVR